MIVNVGYLKNWQKKQKICLSGFEPPKSYYKVESKLYFLDEKNILLQLACGHYPHSNVQATILVPLKELKAKRALHHLIWKLVTFFP
jgi:hypothetical protein